jgi:nucleoporin SEH1
LRLRVVTIVPDLAQTNEACAIVEAAWLTARLLFIYKRSSPTPKFRELVATTSPCQDPCGTTRTATMASSPPHSDEGSPVHEIQSLQDLDVLNNILTAPAFLRGLSPSRLPSHAVSSTPASTTPTQADYPPPAPESQSETEEQQNVRAIQNQLQGFVITHYDTDASYEFKDPQTASEEVNKASIEAWRLFAMATDRGYLTFEEGEGDVVLAVDFNHYGTRMVTASADHKLKVWDRKDDNWALVDSWRSHDAEIVDVSSVLLLPQSFHAFLLFFLLAFLKNPHDLQANFVQVKWSSPFREVLIGSIAEDGRFKLWQEDPLEIPKFGRRFKLIYNQPSETKVPFISLDFKNLPTETYVALTTRDGFLTVLEPENQNNIRNWEPITGSARYLCHTPPHQDETGFKVCFHRELHPSWATSKEMQEHKTLSLAVVAMNEVKVFRTDKDRRFYLAAELTGARNILRDVAWANGSMRGYDVIATASKDGCIRIYQLHVEKLRPATDEAVIPISSQEPSSEDSKSNSRKALSGIGAGLAGSSSREPYREPDPMPDRPSEIVTMVAELNLHQGAIWRVAFSQLGMFTVQVGFKCNSSNVR